MCRCWAALLTLLILDACTSTSVVPHLPIRAEAIPRPQKAGTWEIYEQYARCDFLVDRFVCHSGALYINHNALESAYYCIATGYGLRPSTVTCSQIDVRNSSETGGGIIPGEVKLLSSRSSLEDAGSEGSNDALWAHNYWTANGTIPGVAFCYLSRSPTLESICKAATFDNLP
jgi:hypothetical protein